MAFPRTIHIRNSETGEVREVTVPPRQTFGCICGGTGRVLIDDDAEVHCPHCPAPSNVAQDTDEIARHRVGLL